MEKFDYLYDLTSKEIFKRKNPKKLLFILIFIIVSTITLLLSVIEFLDRRYKNEINRLESSHSYELSVIKHNYNQQLLEIKNQQLETSHSTFKEKVNLLLESARNQMQIPDTVAAYFNTLPNDRPLIQISNYSQYKNSTSNYNYEVESSVYDTLTLYLWVHNTSFNEAVNPVIQLYSRKAKENLICFSASLSATNTNDYVFGSVYLTYLPYRKSVKGTKDLFCFKVIDIHTYNSKKSVKLDNPINILYYEENFSFNNTYNIYTANISALDKESSPKDWFYNQFCIVMLIVPVYSS